MVLVDRKKESLIPFIERKAGLKFERIGAPQPQDVARIAANRAVEAIRVRLSHGLTAWRHILVLYAIAIAPNRLHSALSVARGTSWRP